MLELLKPVCIRIESVAGLANEKDLPAKCDDMFVEVYPKLSDTTTQLKEVCPRLCTRARAHNTVAHFGESTVWLLGLVPPHVMREWLQHEGVLVEIHDREQRTVLEEDEETPLHPHGLARFPLGQLLDAKTMELALRADVQPARGDKKRRRAETMKRDVLRAEGLLEEEGQAKIQRRMALDKLEFTSNYHLLGTVCTLRASLAVPVPTAAEIQAGDEAKQAQAWLGTEKKEADCEVWVGEGSPKREGQADGSPVRFSTKAYRAKVGTKAGAKVEGPWRKSKAEAVQDEAQLQAAMEDGDDAMQGLSTELQASATTEGLNCRYERFTRIVVSVDEVDYPMLQDVLNTMRNHNAEILGLRPDGAEFLTYQLSQDEKENPHLDLLTGFALNDGESRTFVIEGPRGRPGMKKIIDIVPPLDTEGDAEVRSGFKPSQKKKKVFPVRLLHNESLGFHERLYIDFGPKLRQVKVRQTLEQLASRPELYILRPELDVEGTLAAEAPKLLMGLKQMQWLRALRDGCQFPTAGHVVNMEILYGGFATDEELEGKPPRTCHTATSGSQKVLSRQSASLHLEDHMRTRKVKALQKLPTRANLDMENPDFEEHLEMRKSQSVPDFSRVNKLTVHQQSEENVRLHDLLGKKRERETPFLDGQQVYIYSQQRLNCCEKQKEWLRKHMETEKEQKLWSYCPQYNSCTFELEGAAEPGVPVLKSSRLNNSYANLPGDDRPAFRLPHARPAEEFKKPDRDLDNLQEPFIANEWHKVACSDSRHKPTAVYHTFDMNKVPHHRTTTVRPFDPPLVLGCHGSLLGPKSDFESVYYDARPAGGTFEDDDLVRNREEWQKEKNKIRDGHWMKTWDKGSTRNGVTDTDRYERLLKDKPCPKLKGGHEPAPVTIHTSEGFHELGSPTHEWQARLRENDGSPPFNVGTGAYVARDPNIGTRRARFSGKLTKAPWQHGAECDTRTMRAMARGMYPSNSDFNLTRPPPKSKITEMQLSKSASRLPIASLERTQVQYLRPSHYGVHLELH